MTKKDSIILPSATPLEKAVAKLVTRGYQMLDAVTPGWFNPINPDTLVVSNREFCVFAQAHHNFTEGIVQVAKAAAAQGKAIRTFPNAKQQVNLGRGRYTGFPAGSVDVFYYGFEVDAELAGLAKGSRRAAWAAIDAAWLAVVKQKKGQKIQGLTKPQILKLIRDDGFATGVWDVEEYRGKLLAAVSGIHRTPKPKVKVRVV